MGQHPIDHRQQQSHDSQYHQQRYNLAHGAPAHQIQGIAPAPDAPAQLIGVGHDGAKQLVGIEIHIVVQGQKAQRKQHRDNTLMPDPGADLCHHPAQHAGQLQNEHRHQQRQHHTANHSARTGRYGKIHHHGGHHHHGAEHQTHQIHARQPRHKDIPHRDRQGQQQVIVLGLVQAGIGVEYAAEHPHKDGDQNDQCVV